MKLIDIILEAKNTPAEDAKRMGLSYMGFGRWGKDGKVTHKTNAETQKLEKVTHKNKPPVGKKSSQEPEKDTQERKSVVPKFTKLGKKLATSVSKTPSVQEVATTTAASFGRTTPPKIQSYTFLDRLIKMFAYAGESKPLAVYDFKNDIIKVPTRQEEETTFSDDVNDWDNRTFDLFNTIIHESIHSASLRLRSDNYHQDSLGMQLEEGLTEAITRSTAQSFIESRFGVKDKQSTTTAYEGLANAIDIVTAESGGKITHETLMATKTMEELKSVLIPEMQKIVISKLEEQGFTTQQIKRLQTTLEIDDMGVMLLFEPVQRVLYNKQKTTLEEKLKSLELTHDEIKHVLGAE